MKTTKRVTAVLAAAMLMAAGAANAAPECEANYKQVGNLFTGRTFTDWAAHPDKKVDAAFKILYTGFVKSGLRIVNVDKEMHSVIAEQPTVLDTGAPSVLSYSTIVEPDGKGSKISVTLRSPPNKALSADAVKKSLCSIVNLED